MGSLLRLLRTVPSWGVAFLSWVVGSLIYGVHFRRRRIALDNLQRALGSELPPPRIRQLARRNFAHVVRVALEMAYLPRLRGKVDAVVRIDDEEPLAEAVKQGKGVLLLVSHLGNFAYGAARVATSFPTVMVFRPPSNRLVRWLTEWTAQRMNIEMVHRRRGMRGILRALHRGKVVLVALDQHTAKDSVVVDFFDRPAATSTVVAALALKYQIPVVPAFTWREDTGFRAVYSPEVVISRTGNLDRDLRENTQQFTTIIEQQIRSHPDQWLWMHRRWRRD